MTLHEAAETWRQRTALGQTKARETSRQLVLAELLLRSDDVPQGAAEILADRWAPMFDRARPEVIADYIRRHLSDPDVVRVSRAHDPEPGGPVELGELNFPPD